MMIMAGCMLIMCFDRKHKVPKSLINQLPRNILFLFKVRESRKGKIVLEYIFCIPSDIRDEIPGKHSRSRTSQPTLNPHHASCSITEGAPFGHLQGNQDLRFVPTPEHASVPEKHR